MRFEYPHLLWFLLLFVPGLIVFFCWSWRRKEQLVKQFVAARLLSQLTVGVSSTRQKARLGLVVAAVALLILALARFQIGFTWEEARSRGLDVVVAIDTSRSMLATDLSPNRLRRAQLAALDLKRLARGDRLGLVAFAGSAFLQCPLTLDDEAFRQSVETLDVTIIPQGGTALAEAIEAAKSAFKQGNDNHKVLVLFTDGEDHDGNALEAAQAAAKEGMRIFTIGVGTANGELLRTVDVQGRTEFIKDSEGNAVKSRLNEPLLKDMAQEAGGFYMLLSGANTMNLLYERGLSPLPKGEQASQRIKRHHERYQSLLGLALALLLLEMFLPERRNISKSSAAAASAGTDRPSGPFGKTVAPQVATATAAAGSAVRLAIWLIGFACVTLPHLAYGSAAEGLKQYQKGRFDRALTEYEQSLKKKPDDARLLFNAGTAAFQNKDYGQAAEHLNSALVTQDLPLQQRSYYNLGNTQFRMGEDASELQKKRENWEQALRNYDSALRLDPKDADAEFNKDLVKKKLEELKQQQQQQQKQNQKQDNQDKKDDQNKDQQSKQNQQQQNKDQKKQEQQQQQQQQKDQQSQEQQQQQQQKQDQAAQQDKDKDKDKEKENKAQQASPKDNQAQPGKEGEGEDGQPQQARAMRMTPQQAVQLLETLRGDEKVMLFRPPLKTNRQDRVFKDW
ncbi:MAG TPA: VWA domain-containing protein [Verrucomicrobiae bacterium]|nr:VWA domain-containing protein [Verrucomicrobiae bacterium]